MIKLIDTGIIENLRAAIKLKTKLGIIYLVYEYIEHSFKDLVYRDRFHVKDIVSIGVQLLEAIKNIHSMGLVHSDIKLDNIMVDSQNQVFLIDYGLVQQFKLPDGTHRPNLKPEVFTGNVAFGSKNCLDCNTVSQRDDLIQMVYNLMFLHNRF